MYTSTYSLNYTRWKKLVWFKMKPVGFICTIIWHSLNERMRILKKTVQIISFILTPVKDGLQMYIYDNLMFLFEFIG